MSADARAQSNGDARRLGPSLVGPARRGLGGVLARGRVDAKACVHAGTFARTRVRVLCVRAISVSGSSGRLCRRKCTACASTHALATNSGLRNRMHTRAGLGILKQASKLPSAGILGASKQAICCWCSAAQSSAHPEAARLGARGREEASSWQLWKPLELRATGDLSEVSQRSIN